MNKKIGISITGVLLLFIGSAVAASWEPMSPRYGKLCNHADVTNDFVVNALDLSKVRFSYQNGGCTPKNNWCSEADQNFDGSVNELDSAIVSGWIGKTCPKPEVNELSVDYEKKYEL